MMTTNSMTFSNSSEARDNEDNSALLGSMTLTTASVQGVVILLVVFVVVGWASVAGADELAGPRVDDDTPRHIEQIVVDDRKTEPQRDELSAEQEQELTERLQAGMEAEEEQDYERARDYYRQAYEIHPHSNLLLSVVRTSDHHGEPRTARTGYQTFLQRQPDYGNRDEVESRIAGLEQQIEQEEEQQEPEASESALLPSEVGWAGAGAVLTGGVSLIAAGVISSSVDDDFQQLDAAVADGEREDALLQARDIGRRQAWGQFWLYSGVLMITAGAGLIAADMLLLDRSAWRPWLLGGSESSADGVGANVSVGEQGVMLQFSGSF